jgi:hypothetical protein
MKKLAKLTIRGISFNSQARAYAEKWKPARGDSSFLSLINETRYYEVAPKLNKRSADPAIIARRSMPRRHFGESVRSRLPRGRRERGGGGGGEGERGRRRFTRHGNGKAEWNEK